MLSEGTFLKLKNFVEQGGILILNKHCGIKDTLNRFLPLLAPGLFREMAGISIPVSSSKGSMSGNLVMGKDNQMKNQTFALVFPDDKKEYQPLTVIEQLELNGAQPIAFVSGGELTGKAVIALNHYKKGAIVYVGTDSDDPDFYAHWANLLTEKFEIKPILEVPAGLDVISRTKDSTEYIFILNYTTLAQTVKLPKEMEELITNQHVKGKMEIEPLGVRILAKKQ
jgi:beta-galactosidase GanA